MKFESNKINLYLGIGYLFLGIVSMFSLINQKILLGLTVAGLCFSLSLLALAVENTLVPKQKLSRFATEKKPASLLENIQTIRDMLEKKPKNKDTLHWVQLAGGICFMLGFVFLVALPGFNFSEEAIDHMCSFAYVTSLGVVFISFYLEEKQAEKYQRDEEKEMVSYLFDQLEATISSDETLKNRTVSDPAPKEHPAPAPEAQPAPAADPAPAGDPDEEPVQDPVPEEETVEVQEELPAEESSVNFILKEPEEPLLPPGNEPEEADFPADADPAVPQPEPVEEKSGEAGHHSAREFLEKAKKRLRESSEHAED